MSESIGEIAARAFPAIVGQHDLVAPWHGGSKLILNRTAECLGNCTAADNAAYRAHEARCESPIERLAFAALLVVLSGATVTAQAKDLKGRDDWEFAIVPQMKIHGCRLDFGVLNRQAQTIYDLELDGRRFHADRGKDVDRTVVLWRNGIITHRVNGRALCRAPLAPMYDFARKVRGYE